MSLRSVWMESVMSAFLGENFPGRLEQAVDAFVLFAGERPSYAQLHVARKADALPRRFRHLPVPRGVARGLFSRLMSVHARLEERWLGWLRRRRLGRRA